ncbi:hypothetical protein ES708_09002 [subsurface metagenome]
MLNLNHSNIAFSSIAIFNFITIVEVIYTLNLMSHCLKKEDQYKDRGITIEAKIKISSVLE